MQVHHGGLVAESSEGELGIRVKVRERIPPCSPRATFAFDPDS